jgi:phage-related protein
MREVIWIGSSRDDLRSFPDEVQDDIGYALYWAQVGTKHPKAKPLRGFGGAGVLEVVAEEMGNAYRLSTR